MVCEPLPIIGHQKVGDFDTGVRRRLGSAQSGDGLIAIVTRAIAYAELL